jgi:CBS domain containing-hemolysin-like protein
LPLGGESFVADGLEFKIESMNGRHIGKVRITPSIDYEV